MTTIAIIGRPNVGKSTLFNRLTGKKSAIVDNTPGVTRDRKEGDATLGDFGFRIIDTAGLEHAESKSLEALMMMQTEAAMEEADIICMVVDARVGITSQDEFFTEQIRRMNKPVILIANKCEGKVQMADTYDAFRLGLGEPIPVSAEHGLGFDMLYTSLAEIAKKHGLNLESEYQKKEDEILHLALVGRPNAGKSTMFNKLLGEERSIVSDLAGTTRDTVYVNWEYKGQKIRLADTAGLRKKAKRNVENLEKLSVDDSFKAIKFADIVVLLIDAVLGIDKQDLQIADHVLKEGRGLVIALNKWDVVAEKGETLEAVRYRLEKSLAQAKGVPLLPISALTGTDAKKTISKTCALFELWNKRVPTGPLNKWLEKATDAHIPPLSNGKRIRFRYVTQVKARPPTFMVFTSSNLNNLPDSYIRYLTTSLRDEFDFGGVPIRVRMKKSNNPFEGKKK